MLRQLESKQQRLVVRNAVRLVNKLHNDRHRVDHDCKEASGMVRRWGGQRSGCRGQRVREQSVKRSTQLLTSSIKEKVQPHVL